MKKIHSTQLISIFILAFTFFVSGCDYLNKTENPDEVKKSIMARDENGNWVIMDKATPGYSNNEKGYNEFLSSLESSEDKDLVINEILAENKGNFKNELDEYSGYIEVKNISNKTINRIDGGQNI